MAYDPSDRLYEVNGSREGVRRFAYDGPDRIAEYDGANALKRRYVHGPGDDEPLVWYENGQRRFLSADALGSVAVVSGEGGAGASINTYGPYGERGAANAGAFGFTGQTWLAEAGLWHYKARAYSPSLGRFLQTDPIGYGDGLNLYAYVGNDPINLVDPTGLEGLCGGSVGDGPVTLVPCSGSDPWRDQNISDAITRPIGGGSGFGGECDSRFMMSPEEALRADSCGGASVVLAAASEGEDRCKAKESPPQQGGPGFLVDGRKLQTVAAQKFLQHDWPLNNGELQSHWAGMVQSPYQLAGVAALLTMNRAALPASRNSVRITGSLGRRVGYDAVSNAYTSYLTIIYGAPIGIDKDLNLPERPPVSIYPGCPR